MDEKKKATTEGDRNIKKDKDKKEKSKKKRAEKYDEKLAIEGSLDEVLRVAVKGADKVRDKGQVNMEFEEWRINDRVKWSGDPDGEYYIAGHSNKAGYDFIIIHVDTNDGFAGQPRMVKLIELKKISETK